MPSPAETLTEAHRVAQARIGAATAADMLQTWSLLDPANLDATVDRWLNISTRLIAGRRVESARLASQYLQAFRVLETGSPFTPTAVLLGDANAVSTSLVVTGPVSLKQAMSASTTFARAIETAQANTARAGMRHALAGGRDTISATVAADPQAIGYQRVTSGKACEFCSMLADRGAVYSDESAHFEAHDGCSCSAEPVYRS